MNHVLCAQNIIILLFQILDDRLSYDDQNCLYVSTDKNGEETTQPILSMNQKTPQALLRQPAIHWSFKNIFIFVLGILSVTKTRSRLSTITKTNESMNQSSILCDAELSRSHNGKGYQYNNQSILLIHAASLRSTRE